MSGVVLLSVGEAGRFINTLTQSTDSIESSDSPSPSKGEGDLTVGIARVIQRYESGLIRMFSTPERDVMLCCSTLEGAGFDALFVDYVEGRGRSLVDSMDLLREIAQTADFERVACFPVTPSRARLYQRLGFYQSGEFYYLDMAES